MDSKIKQSVTNLQNALIPLKKADGMAVLDDLSLSGALKHFELCFELCWKTLKKIADQKGRRVATPRDAFQFGYEMGWITDEKLWIKLIEHRNETVHVYDRESAEKIFMIVKQQYISEFEKILGIFQTL